MSRGTGIDLGRHSVRLAQVDCKRGATTLLRYQAAALDPGEDPLAAGREVFSAMRPKVSNVRLGATGSDIMLRYLPVPEVEDWRLERLMEFEVRELESRSGSPLATSYNLLPVPRELDDEDTMLLGVIREDLVDRWVEGLGSVRVEGFTPNAVALYNAYLALGDQENSVTLLANIGAGSLDLALVRGSELYFARSVSTGLEKRDQLLADNLGIDAARAERLIFKHLDLALGTGERLSSDGDRVTRPVLPLYDTLPTLMSGVITLCKAQARLRELSLDRVLITGGGARARGLVQLLTGRLRVPVSLWDPTDMVDPSRLAEADLDQLEADGPGATVALGLALSAADSNLYALEILSKAARRSRDFRQRGVFSMAAGVLAVAYLGISWWVTNDRATEVGGQAGRLGAQVRKAQAAETKATEYLQQIEQEEVLLADLEARFAAQRSAAEIRDFLVDQLPANLWVDSLTVELRSGKDWDLPDRTIPVLRAVGRGEDAADMATTAFNAFSQQLWSQLPGGEAAARPSTKRVGQGIEWTIEAHLLDLGGADESDLDAEDQG